MEARNELGLIGTIEDDDDYESNMAEEDSDSEVTLFVGCLHVKVFLLEACFILYREQ